MKYIMAFTNYHEKKYSHYDIKTSVILETGHILLFQKLELLIMVLRVSLGSKIWEITRKHIKELDTIDKFKTAIKKWKL